MSQVTSLPYLYSTAPKTYGSINRLSFWIFAIIISFYHKNLALFGEICLASIADDVSDTVPDATAIIALVLAGAAEAGPHVVRFVPVDCECGRGDRDGRQ